MKRIKILLLFICIILICAKCESPFESEYTIDLVNNAEYPIGYYFAVGGRYGTYYPDSLPETNEYVMYDIRKVVSPGVISHYSWDKFFETLPYNTLSLFIFSTDTLNKYSWEEIRDGYKILKRYDFSQDDLESMKWIITYP